MNSFAAATGIGSWPGTSPRRAAEVIVFQGAAPSFPLGRAEGVQCGNAVTLPGAFRLDADAPAQVCVVLDPPRGLRAASAARGAVALPDGAGCVTIDPL